MTLACSFATPPPSILESVLWSLVVLAPVMVFLFAPRLLPLRRDLAWALRFPGRARAWLRAVRTGDAAARHAFGHARAEWLAEVQARSATGPLHAVVTSPVLLFRARLVGNLARGVVVSGGVFFAILGFAEGAHLSPAIPWALSMLLTALCAGWLVRVAGEGAAATAQGLAATRGWGGVTRGLVGGAIGAGHGAVAGWTACFVAHWIVLPTISLATLSLPPSRLAMYTLTGGGAVAALLGAAIGATLVAAVAIAARRAPADTGGGCSTGGCSSGGCSTSGCH